MQTTAHPGDDLLNGWIDDALTPGERTMVESHLEHCDRCRTELESLRLVKRLLAELPEPDLPRSFALTVEQAKKSESPAATVQPAKIVTLLPIVRALSIAAVMAVIIMGGALFFGPIGDSQDPPEMTVSRSAVTNSAVDASENANPAPIAAEPGMVIDQGETATNSNTVPAAMANGIQQVNGNNGEERSNLEIATIATGAFAAIAVGAWVSLYRLGRNVPDQ